MLRDAGIPRKRTTEYAALLAEKGYSRDYVVKQLAGCRGLGSLSQLEMVMKNEKQQGVVDYERFREYATSTLMPWYMRVLACLRDASQQMSEIVRPLRKSAADLDACGVNV